MSTAGELLGRLAGDLERALGPSLLSLAVHGSWVVGDFVDGRSGLGLLAILDRDPGRAELGALALVHEWLVRDFPEWAEHIEIDYVSPEAVADALAGGTEHVVARICPGELLHLSRVSLQYLLNWRSAVQANQVLVGACPSTLLPHISDHVVREAVLANVRQWPAWMLDLRGAGGEAFAVLTVCRAAVLLRTDAWVSKRAAAERMEHENPGWAPVIRWSRDWWYAGGLRIEPERREEVSAFVQEVCRTLLAEAGEGISGLAG